MKESISVFVSSTFGDLKSYREAVRSSIRRLGLIDISMENFGSREDRPLKECTRLIRDVDVFVGIYAKRYGFVPPGKKTSITASEYAAAKRAGIPILAYLVDENARWPKAKIEGGVNAERLSRFKSGLLQHHIVSFFSRRDELAAMVAADLGRETRTRRSRIGLLRNLSDESLGREQRLIEQLRSGDKRERDQKASALASLGSRGGIDALVRLMLGSDAELADAAVHALAFGDAVKHGLVSPHSKVRDWAAFRVGENALQDHAWGLEQVQSLVELLERKTEPIDVAARAAHSLAKIGGKKSMIALLKTLDCPGTPSVVAVKALYGPARFWRDNNFESIASYQLVPEFERKAIDRVQRWPAQYADQVVLEDEFKYLEPKMQTSILSRLHEKSRGRSKLHREAVKLAGATRRGPLVEHRRSREVSSVMKEEVFPILEAMAPQVGGNRIVKVEANTGDDDHVVKAIWWLVIKSGRGRITTKDPGKINVIMQGSLDDWRDSTTCHLKTFGGPISLSGEVGNIGKLVDAWNQVVGS